MNVSDNNHHFDENDTREVYNSAIIEDCSSNSKVCFLVQLVSIRKTCKITFNILD
jgi:hypothetical protein